MLFSDCDPEWDAPEPIDLEDEGELDPEDNVERAQQSVMLSPLIHALRR